MLLRFAPAPCLTYLLDTQQDDGRWTDEHGIPHWQPYVTMLVLRALQRHGKWAPNN